MKPLICCIFLLNLFAVSALAQQTVLLDTGAVFPVRDYYELITRNHPVLRLAALLPEEARQDIVQARGAFDPKLSTAYDRKEFANALYYDRWETGFAVPLWSGLDLKATYERNGGQYLNPEERTPPSGLVGLGVSVPLGQALLIDGRRTAVRQAQVGVLLAEADRIKLINKTLLDAAKAYWDWFLADRQYQLLTEGFVLADTRLNALRQRAALGDAALIDTTEALILVQDRQVQQQQAALDLQNARLRVTAYLWGSVGQPLDLPPTARPEPPTAILPDEALLQALLDRAATQHPDLLKLDGKARQLSLDERLGRALLQPQIALSASLLSRSPVGPADPATAADYYAFRMNNNKIGLDVVFPLLLRKERGKLRQIQIKQQQVIYDRQQTGRDVQNTVRAAYNSVQGLARQLSIQQQTIRQQTLLLGAEQQKFDLGESSLFLVNTRETKLIDLRLKGEELRAKARKAIAELYFAAGTTE
jgi:outer membrane protein